MLLIAMTIYILNDDILNIKNYGNYLRNDFRFQDIKILTALSLTNLSSTKPLT